MRYLRVGEPGSERAAVMAPDGRVLGLPEGFGDYDSRFWSSDGPARVRELVAGGSLVELDSAARIGAPIAKPEKIVCIGLNYRDHAKETNSPIPSEPIIFMKAPNCIVGPRDGILIPRGSVKTDWEVELGVVIGAQGRYLESPEAARDVIAGYVLSHDVSEREFQIERGGQWDKGKCAETFNPLGPWLVSADEIADPQDLRLTLSVNGVVRQDGTTADMIFPVDYVVWYLSQFMVLEPGDLINTGTPKGVSMGHDDVPYLTAGDVVELTIDGLGSQRSELSQA